ncbi:hypothetical protein OG828_15205 [Streptomyces sp. NBC_00457]|uniref:hypothetical protein n=1 Tax=unclassified Streptomyces TaxID=2593676 RepID=UPI002E1CD903|nr:MULTISPECIES: hypothetical protein [unclassified Streptomyces]
MKQRTLWAASCGSVSDSDSASGGPQGKLVVLDAGIGYAVAKWTKDPKVAADRTVDVSSGGPAVATTVSELDRGKPADLMGRLSQQLLSGSVTVDAPAKQPAASDQAG